MQSLGSLVFPFTLSARIFIDSLHVMQKVDRPRRAVCVRSMGSACARILVHGLTRHQLHKHHGSMFMLCFGLFVEFGWCCCLPALLRVLSSPVLRSQGWEVQLLPLPGVGRWVLGVLGAARFLGGPVWGSLRAPHPSSLLFDPRLAFGASACCLGSLARVSRDEGFLGCRVLRGGVGKVSLLHTPWPDILTPGSRLKDVAG